MPARTTTPSCPTPRDPCSNHCHKIGVSAIEAIEDAQDASALEEIKRIAIKQLRMIAIGVAGWRSGRLRLRRNGTPVVKSPGNELEFCLGDRAVGSAAWLARLPNPPGRRPT